MYLLNMVLIFLSSDNFFGCAYLCLSNFILNALPEKLKYLWDRLTKNKSRPRKFKFGLPGFFM